jgi:hypothetical protein
MQKITQTIRDAEIINTPSAGNTDTSISIGMSTPADNPTIINFSGGNVTIKNGAAAPININSNTVIVTGLTFTNLTPAGGKGTVRLALTVSSINPDGVKNLSYTQTLYATATIK